MKILIGFSGNPETTAFTRDSSREKRQLERVTHGIGGTSVNFALQAIELGADVSLALTVGNDPMGKAFESLLLELFHEKVNWEGLDYDEVIPDWLTLLQCRDVTSFAHVVIEETEQGNNRTLDSCKGKYNAFPHDKVKELVESDNFNAVVMTGVTVDEVPLVVTAFRHARGIKVLNPRAELTADKNAFLNVLADTDILCMNEKEFSAYVDGGDPDQALSLLHRAFGGRVVIVTKGSEGLLLVDKNGKRHEIPACISGDEIDATGAGDAFLATFLVRYLSGDTAVEAAQYGSFVAGIAVTKVGGSNTVTAAEMGNFSEEKVMQEYQFDPSQFENGALKPVIGKEVRQGKFRDCPACCIGPYCRDGDVELIYNETHGVYYYECGFVYNETEACGFRYPGDWENDDPRIEALAKIHRAFLSSLRQEVAA